MKFYRLFIYLTSFSVALIIINVGTANGVLLIWPEDTEVVVGQSVTISCHTSDVYSVHWEHTLVGSRTSREIYISKTVVRPYSWRVTIVGDSNKGEYNLTIGRVELSDAGKYHCIDRAGHGEKKDAQLIVLESFPQCNSNSNPDGMIGDNDCGIEPEDIKIVCTLRYSGNIPPVLEWMDGGSNSTPLKTLTIERFPDEDATTFKATFTSVIRSDHRLSNNSIICKTALSKLHCASDVEKFRILYVFNTSSTLQINQSSHVTCSANSSQQCMYTWTEFIRLEENKIASAINSIHIDRPGRFICKAECEIRQQKCTVLPKSVEFITIGPAAKATQEISVSESFILVIVGLSSASASGMSILAFLFIRRRRRNRPLTYRSEDLLPETILVRGVAVLQNQIYVIRHKINSVLVYPLVNPNNKMDPEIKEIAQMSDPRDIAACSTGNCLYITDAEKRFVYKMEIGRNTRVWLEDIEKPFTISVNSKGHVLLPRHPNMIDIYESDALGHHSSIVLSDDIHDIQHAVEFKPDRFIVSYGERNDGEQEVMMVWKTGTALKKVVSVGSGDNLLLNHPRHVAVGDGQVYVADERNNRVVVLNEDLEFLHAIAAAKVMVQPTRLCYNDGRLLVGQRKGIHLFMDEKSKRVKKNDRTEPFRFRRKEPPRKAEVTPHDNDDVAVDQGLLR